MKKRKYGWIRAEVKSGKYKDNQIEIDIGKTGAETIVKINGKVMNNVESAHLHMHAGSLTRLILHIFQVPGKTK